MEGAYLSADGDSMVSAAGDALETQDQRCPECGCGDGPGDGPCCQFGPCDYITQGPFTATVTANLRFRAEWSKESRGQYPGAYQDLDAALVFSGEIGDSFAGPCGGTGSGESPQLEITGVPGQDGVEFPFPTNNWWKIQVFNTVNQLAPKDRLSVQIQGTAFTAPAEGFPGTGSSFSLGLGLASDGSVQIQGSSSPQTITASVTPVYSGLCLVGIDISFSFNSPAVGTAPNIIHAAYSVSGTIGVRLGYLRGCSGSGGQAATWDEIARAWL